MRDPLEVAPGFGHCERCPIRESATYDLCFRCARRSLTALPDWNQRCAICSRPFNPGEDACRNGLCRPTAARWFEWNYPVALRDSRLQRVIERYKFNEKWGWAIIFGRIVVGALELDPDTFRPFDLIVASPSSPGRFDHAQRVLRYAAREAPRASAWPFDLDDPCLAMTEETPRMSKTKSIAERASTAQHQLRAALKVRHPDRTRDKAVLVFDDTFTTGNTLNEVARALQMQGGAARVCGISLCRQPWTRRP